MASNINLGIHRLKVGLSLALPAAIGAYVVWDHYPHEPDFDAITLASAVSVAGVWVSGWLIQWIIDGFKK